MNHPTDRISRLLGDASKSTPIIEIGPSYNPIAPKRSGWNTIVIDHADQTDLRAKYDAIGTDTSSIEPVDYVWTGGRLEDLIPVALHGRFERLIASHVIEHIPDPITFMRSAELLLAPGGALALAVPDKRFCFDYFKPVSTTGDLLAAHDPEGPGRHSTRTLFQQAAYSVAVDGKMAFGQHPVSATALATPLEAAFYAATFGKPATDQPYIDAHAWHFTPAAFQLAILEVAEAGLIDWRIAEISPAVGAEFIVVLRRGRSVWPDKALRDAERLRLLVAMLAETHEQLTYAARGGLLALPEIAIDASTVGGLAELRSLVLAQTLQLSDITERLERQQRRLDDVHLVAHWIRRLVGPLHRLRARMLGRAPDPTLR